MPRKLTQRELRNDSGEIMRALEAGDSFIVTRGGLPVGELIPLRRRPNATLSTVVEIFKDAPPVDRKRLRADIDALADQDPTPRG